MHSRDVIAPRQQRVDDCTKVRTAVESANARSAPVSPVWKALAAAEYHVAKMMNMLSPKGNISDAQINGLWDKDRVIRQ